MKEIHVHSPAKRLALRWILPVASALLRLFSRSEKLERATVSPKRILILRPDHIGDAIMASAVLKPLRDRFPDAHLALCVGPWAAPLFLEHPLLDELIVASLPWWTKIRGGTAPRGESLGWFALLLHIRRRRYDMLIDLRSDLRHIAIYGVLGGIRHILAYSRTGGAEFLSASVPYKEELHEVTKSVRLLEPLGIQIESPALYIPVNTRAVETLAEKLAAKGILPGEPIVTLCPQTRLRVKEWPLDSWRELIARLSASHPAVKIALIGDSGMPVSFLMETKDKVSVFAGSLALDELNALFSRSLLVIGSDSAPLHLAACSDVPIVGLFGPTRPENFAPFTGGFHLIQGHCVCNRDLHLDCDLHPGESGACMRRISASAVAALASRLLEKFPTAEFPAHAGE